MADWKPPAVSDLGTAMERDQALIDARDMIRERGQVIKIRLNKESTVSRDDFNSIKKRATTPGTSFYAFPIIFNPTVKQMDDAGIREKTDVLIKTAMLDWNDAGYPMERLQKLDMIRATIIINDAKYEITTKQFDSQYQDTYLYIHIGANKI